jgi:hypothetical protein
MPRLASALAASWQCQHCGSDNNSTKNKRHCSLCRAWRDGIAPLSAAGIAIVDAHGGSGSPFICSNKNNAPNNASPCKVGSPTKRGAKRMFPAGGLGNMVLHPLPPPSPTALQLTCSITPPPPLQCRGIYGSFFGSPTRRRTRALCINSTVDISSTISMISRAPEYGFAMTSCNI